MLLITSKLVAQRDVIEEGTEQAFLLNFVSAC